MIYDTFLFTRDDEDYGWRKKPDYLPKDLYKKCRNLINLREKAPDWKEDKWKKMVFGVCIEGYPILGRVIATNAEDPFGRPIFSFEGLVVEKITKRHILDIVNVINYFNDLGCSFRDLYVEGSLENSITIDEITNPLDYSYGLCEEDESKITALEKMILDSGNFDLGYGFLYGEDVGYLFPYVTREYDVEKLYDASETYSIKQNDMDAGMEIQTIYIENKSKEKNVIKLKLLEIRRNIYGYRWVLETDENKDLAETKIKKIKRKIDIGTLLEEERRLREYLMLIGM